MQDGLSEVQRSVVGVRRRTLGKNMETHRTGVSDRHDGHAGWTVVGMTVCHMCLLKDIWKKNGQWGISAFGTDPMTVRHRGLVL